jgi:alkyl hydroperoxide reductase subunit AhpC
VYVLYLLSYYQKNKNKRAAVAVAVLKEDKKFKVVFFHPEDFCEIILQHFLRALQRRN